MKTENVEQLTIKAHEKGWKDWRGQKTMTIDESKEETLEKFKEDITAYDSSNDKCKSLTDALADLTNETKNILLALRDTDVDTLSLAVSYQNSINALNKYKP